MLTMPAPWPHGLTPRRQDPGESGVVRRPSITARPPQLEAEPFRSNQEGIRRAIETALARRTDGFALTYLAWTAHGYTVKFGQGIVVLVRTAVDGNAIEDEARRDKLLDGVRGEFRVFNSTKRGT